LGVATTRERGTPLATFLFDTTSLYSDGHSEEIVGRAPVPGASFPIQMIDVSKTVSITVLISAFNNPPRPVGATLERA
jgi:hypothetical protein